MVSRVGLSTNILTFNATWFTELQVIDTKYGEE